MKLNNNQVEDWKLGVFDNRHFDFGPASYFKMKMYNYFQVIEDIFLHHPIYGIYSRKTPRAGAQTECDFCLWILYIGKKGKVVEGLGTM